MPFLDVSIRQALGVVGSCPSEEDITAAAQARGLQFDPLTLQLTAAEPPRPPRKPAAKTKTAQASAGAPDQPIQPNA